MDQEPGDRSFVYGRVRDHWIAGDIWHRDDREGHGDPREFPQRWWWHGGNRWMSWPEIQQWAQEEDLELTLLVPAE